MNRAEWLLYFLDTARGPVRPSGPAVDRAEWLSIFLAAANTPPSRTGRIEHLADRDAVELSHEDRAEETSAPPTQAAAEGQRQARSAGREEQQHAHGETR